MRDPIDDELARDREEAQRLARTETPQQRLKRQREFARDAAASEFGRARRRARQP